MGDNEKKKRPTIKGLFSLIIISIPLTLMEAIF